VDVVVDLRLDRVGVEGWETLTSLAVRVDGGPPGGPDSRAEDGLTSTLAAAGIGRAGTAGDALVPPGVLRGLAVDAAAAQGRGPDGEWDAGFAAMIGHARDAGWIDDDGAVRAHVEWRDA